MGEKWIKLAVGIVALIVAFGSGFLTGRLFPAHHYERFGTSSDLFDTATGHVCTLSSPDPFAKYQVPPDPNASKDAGSYWTEGSKPTVPPCNP